MPKPIFVLNGPNLNLLGEREPHIYGRGTLADVEARCATRAAIQGFEIVFRQTNREGELIDWVQDARGEASALVINPAGYGHTSIALHDALKALHIPIIECHISNPAAREPFRHHSYVSPVASGVICGLGVFGYELAIDGVCKMLAAA